MFMKQNLASQSQSLYLNSLFNAHIFFHSISLLYKTFIIIIIIKKSPNSLEPKCAGFVLQTSGKLFSFLFWISYQHSGLYLTLF